LQLGSADDLPVEGKLVFFVKSVVPAHFPRDSKVEIAAADGGFHTVLSLTDASLMLEDARTAMGSVEPLARFGASAFGPVQLRVLAANGTAGDWLPLGTLVRLPGFKDLHCPRATAKPCTLTGTNLFLAAAFSATQDFSSATEVPAEFTGTQLAVPHPANGVLYMKLRDDPATVQTLALPATPAAGEAKTASLPAVTASAPAASPNEPPETPAPASPAQSTPGDAAATDKNQP